MSSSEGTPFRQGRWFAINGADLIARGKHVSTNNYFRTNFLERKFLRHVGFPWPVSLSRYVGHYALPTAQPRCAVLRRLDFHLTAERDYPRRKAIACRSPTGPGFPKYF